MCMYAVGSKKKWYPEIIKKIETHCFTVIWIGHHHKWGHIFRMKSNMGLRLYRNGVLLVGDDDVDGWLRKFLCASKVVFSLDILCMMVIVWFMNKTFMYYFFAKDISYFPTVQLRWNLFFVFSSTVFNVCGNRISQTHSIFASVTIKQDECKVILNL